MPTGQARLTAYVASVALAASVAVAYALPRVSLWQAIVVIGGVALAELYSTNFREDVHVSVASIVILVAVLLGGTPLAILSAIGVIPRIALRASDLRWTRVTFNWAQYTLAATAAGGAYELATQWTSASFPAWPTLLAVAAAAVSYSVVNHSLVAGVISITTTDRFLQTLKTIGPSVILQVPYAGIAVLAAVVIHSAGSWALLLMAVPTLIARYGLLAFHKLDESYDVMVRSFVKAIEMKDLYTRGHSERVAELSVLVAEELGISYEERRLTRYAALLHDVGKIGVPLCIINKPGPLDDREFAEIKKHPTIGADILHDIDFLAPAIDIVRYHHERLDGRGYPFGVGDAQLSDIVRIVTVVDAFDAMTSTRSYRRALRVSDAISELRRCSGRQFDPRMVEALAVVADRVGWQPTVEFASDAELHGHQIPVGTAQERLSGAETTSHDARW